MCIGRLLDSGKVSFCKSKLKVENNSIKQQYWDLISMDLVMPDVIIICTAVLVWLNREKP